MIDYTKEYEQLETNLNNEIFEIFNKLEKRGFIEPLYMGKDEKKKPVIHPHYQVIKISLDTEIEGHYMKCNHIGYDTFCMKPNSLFIKGFQVARKKYRMIPIKQMALYDKLPIVEHLRTLV